MPAEELSDVGAVRQQRPAAFPSHVEGLGDEPGREAVALVARLDLGVVEGVKRADGAVLQEAGEVVADPDLETVRCPVVEHHDVVERGSVIGRHQYVGRLLSIWLAQATTPPPTCTASEKPAPLSTASVSADRCPVLQ